jgi:hypothetical protein
LGKTEKGKYEMEGEEIKLENGVLEIQAQSWNGFVAYVADKLSDYRAYIFRGQREPAWKLLLSLDRIDGIKALKSRRSG